MLKIKVRVCDDREGDGWVEEWTTPEGFPSIQAKAVIDKYNATLRPHERPRRIVEIVSFERVADPAKTIEHQWEKQNLVTISDRHGMYDKMKCRVCGATGKRFGLSGVTLDPRQPKGCK